MIEMQIKFFFHGEEPPISEIGLKTLISKPLSIQHAKAALFILVSTNPTEQFPEKLTRQSINLLQPILHAPSLQLVILLVEL